MQKLSKRGWWLAVVLVCVSSSLADPVPLTEIAFDAETAIQSRTVGITQSTSMRGDLNLDGIPYSIADWMMITIFYGCIMDPGPWPPLDIQAQADLNCDGELTYSDLSRILSVLMGVEPPLDCPTSAPPHIDRPERPASAAASENYSIEIRDLLIPGVETGWVEVVLTEAPEVMTGFQLNIEYDSDRLEFVEFVDGLVGDHLDPRYRSHETIVEPGKSCLRIAGHHCLSGASCPRVLSLPDLPVTLTKLKFRVLTTDEDFDTELNFAWDFCSDNGISVGPETASCGWWPDHLAVSNNVYNASGDDITDFGSRYGGAGEECMGGGPRDIPVRQINFHSGTLSYQQSCCVGNMGDPNGSGGDEPTIGDISVIIHAKFIVNSCDEICIPEADINGSGGANPTCEDITIGDIALLIDCLFITGNIAPCYQPCPGGI